jgi:predicted Zn-dependent protease
MPSRLEMLRALVAQGKADSFAHYGLAMELRTSGQLQEAWDIFQLLLKTQPDYIPAYSPAADTLLGLGRTEEARNLCRQGIDACERKGQSHARDQLKTTLGSLE